MFEYSASLDFIRKIEFQLPKDRQSFLCSGSFGDIYFMLSTLSRASLSKQINAMVPDWAAKIPQLFPNLPENISIFTYPASITQALHNGLLRRSFELNINGTIIPLLPTLYPCIPELITSGKLNYLDFLTFITGADFAIPTNLLSLPKELIDEASNICISAGMAKGKAVIISVDNNTNPEFSADFWISIVELIKSKGLIPFLNTSFYRDDHQRILAAGALNINLPPHLVVPIINFAGHYCGGMNGLMTIASIFCKNAKVCGFIHTNGDEPIQAFDRSGQAVSVKNYLSNSGAYPILVHENYIELSADISSKHYENDIPNF
jgi:hypothetical protein